jgi:adenosylcobinamide kinase / adenosylcobinamide-phosphate guanylyltransferase
MALTMLVGGARSGKSRLAVELAGDASGPVVFIATATSIDDDMSDRIARHREARPPEWSTVEEPLELEKVIAEQPADATVIVDCLTLWVSNLMVEERGEAEIVERADSFGRIASERLAPTIVISNEVGSGVHPPTELGRRYQDLLGRVNAACAGHAQDCFLVVAGRVLRLQDPGELSLG